MKVGDIIVRRVRRGSIHADLEAGDACQIETFAQSGQSGEVYVTVRLLRTGRVQPGVWMLSLFDPLEPAHDT